MGEARSLWLNRKVPGQWKYRLQNQRRTIASDFIWLLVGLGLIGVVWIWWNANKSPNPERQARPVSASPPAASAAPPTAPRNTALPATQAGEFPRPTRGVFEAQLALERQGISSGSIDGVIGSQTRAAIRVFQAKSALPVTGELDGETRSRLVLAGPPLTSYSITSNDVARLQPLSATWLGKSQQTALDYETILEMVAERSHTHPGLVRRLNPEINWTNVAVGTGLRIPDAALPEPMEKAAFAVISLAEKKLEAFDLNTNVLVHFPCSIAQRVEKRPVGELHVAVIAPNPNYTFDPDVFPESPEAQQLKVKLVLPPGPNNPVGSAWIGLDKPGYGIHGTPNPELVGRTESHGCFRLANWNAEYLLKLVWVGMPVYVEP